MGTPEQSAPAGLPLRSRRRTYAMIAGIMLGTFLVGIGVPFVFADPADNTLARPTVTSSPQPSAPPTSDGSPLDGATEPEARATEAVSGRLPTDLDRGGPRPTTGTPTSAPSAGPTSGAGGQPTAQPSAGPTGTPSAPPAGPPIKLGAMILDLAAVGQLGFDAAALDVEVQKAVWTEMVREVNDGGGINGRPIELVFRNYDPLSESNMREACLALTQDERVFLAVAPGGFVGSPILCFTEENDTPFIVAGSSGVPQEYYTRSRGLLFTMFMGSDRTMYNFANEVAAIGGFEGKRVGILFDLRSGPESVADSLEQAIAAHGGNHVYTSIFSADLATASSQVPVEVQQHSLNEVDVILNAANALVIAQFTQEAESQRYFPTYYTSDWNGGSSDFYFSNVASSFDGMLNFSTTRTGEWRNLDEHPDDARCRELVNRATGEEYSREDNVYTRECTAGFMAFEGLRAAGADLTNETFSAGMQGLGRLGYMPGFGGGRFGPGQFDAPDRLRTMRWQADCTCIVPISDFRAARY